MNQQISYKKSIYFAVVCITLLFIVSVAFQMRNAYIDDAFIGFRCVKNLLNGHGFVFNPNERVEGVTNIGWLFVLCLPSLFLPPELVAKILSIVLVLATLWLSFLVFNRIVNKKHGSFALFIPLLISSHFDYVFFSFSGMETALLAFCLMLILYLAVSNRSRCLIILLCAFCFLLHPECIIIYPLVLIFQLLSQPQEFKRYRYPFVLFILSISVISLLRLSYYGDLLPNTFWAKPPAPLGQVMRLFSERGFSSTNISAPFSDTFILFCILFAFLTQVKRNESFGFYGIAIFLAGFLFAIYAPADWTGTGRYFAPFIPVAVIYTGIGLLELINRLTASQNTKTILKGLLSIGFMGYIIINGFKVFAYFQPANLANYPNYVMVSDKLIPPAEWIKKNLPDEAVIASRRIGALGYHSEKYIFEYTFGLTDRDIARMLRKNGRPFQSPADTMLQEIWHHRNPDYVLEDNNIIDPLIHDLENGALQIHGITYRIVKRFPINRTTDWVLCKKSGYD